MRVTEKVIFIRDFLKKRRGWIHRAYVVVDGGFNNEEIGGFFVSKNHGFFSFRMEISKPGNEIGERQNRSDTHTNLIETVKNRVNPRDVYICVTLKKRKV